MRTVLPAAWCRSTTTVRTTGIYRVFIGEEADTKGMAVSDLTGKRAFITGSGRGIGAASAELAIARGASVIISDIDSGRAGQTADHPGFADTSMADRDNAPWVTARTYILDGGLTASLV